MGKILKGEISTLSQKAGMVISARVVPDIAPSEVTPELLVPWWMRGDRGGLSSRVKVIYAIFEDGTGMILSRADGELAGEFTAQP